MRFRIHFVIEVLAGSGARHLRAGGSLRSTPATQSGCQFEKRDKERPTADWSTSTSDREVVGSNPTGPTCFYGAVAQRQSAYVSGQFLVGRSFIDRGIMAVLFMHRLTQSQRRRRSTFAVGSGLNDVRKHPDCRVGVHAL